jgi:subtilisin family serine protease
LSAAWASVVTGPEDTAPSYRPQRVAFQAADYPRADVAPVYHGVAGRITISTPSRSWSMTPRPDRLAHLHAREDVDTFDDGVRWFRRGELLVDVRDGRNDFDVELTGLGAVRDPAPTGALEVMRYTFADAPEQAPRRVAEYLDRHAVEGAPNLSLNHVFHGEPRTRAARHDRRAGHPLEPVRGARPVKVGILDTGLAPHRWLEGRIRVGRDDREAVDQDGDGRLGLQTGHGTFIAGIVLQHAPAAEITIAKVLDEDGVTDELTIATALARLHADVDIVNLSLGGYTVGDRPPLSFARALQALEPEAVIVAAAGNAGLHDRPFWPAAFPFPDVVAVAALDEDGKLAAFSNYGPWVDLARPGVDVLSTFPTHDGPRRADEAGDPDLYDGFARWSGTSFAAARVTGEIAAAMAASAHGVAELLATVPGDRRRALASIA